MKKLFKEVLNVINSHDAVIGLSLKNKLRLMLDDTIIKHLDYWLTGKFHKNHRVCPLPYGADEDDIFKIFGELTHKFNLVFGEDLRLDKYILRRKNAHLYDNMWKELYSRMLDGQQYEQLYMEIREFYENNLMTSKDNKLKQQDQWPSSESVLENLKQLRIDPKMVQSQIDALRYEEHEKVIGVLQKRNLHNVSVYQELD